MDLSDRPVSSTSPHEGEHSKPIEDLGVTSGEITNARNASKELESQVDNQPQYLEAWRLGIMIGCLFVATMLTAIDINMLNVAVPKISSELNALGQVAWIGSTYLLTMF
jgi:hypothetical protein